jgi:hypothetical protein
LKTKTREIGRSCRPVSGRFLVVTAQGRLIVKRHRRNLIALGLVAALPFLSLSRAHAGLVINPTFDSTITSDPNAAAIEGTINTAISTYESTFSNNITVNITFKEMTTGLGMSNFTVFTVPYTRFLAALAAEPQTSDPAPELRDGRHRDLVGPGLLAASPPARGGLKRAPGTGPL